MQGGCGGAYPFSSVRDVGPEVFHRFRPLEPRRPGSAGTGAPIPRGVTPPRNGAYPDCTPEGPVERARGRAYAGP